MADPRYVYVTYIRTTAEKLWQALLDPELTRLYWCDTRVDADWKVGGAWTRKTPDGQLKDSGEILEIDPPKRLVMSWRNEFRPEIREEGFSRATYELEPQGDTVKLTIIHEFEKPDSKFLQAVSGGWPLILASLKSLLETGEPLEQTRTWPPGK